MVKKRVFAIFLTYRCVGRFREYLPTLKTHSRCNHSVRPKNDIIFGETKKFGLKTFFEKKTFFKKKCFSTISPFIVFGDLKVHFSMVWLSYCLLIPLHAIAWRKMSLISAL